MGKWYFDLQGEEQDLWVWRQMSDDGKLLQIARQAFRHFGECAEDALKHGYDGSPNFRPALRRWGAAAVVSARAAAIAQKAAAPSAGTGEK